MFLVEGLTQVQIMTKVFCSLACAVMIAFITSKIIGPANKAAWFRKRTRNSFFLKRGFLGNECHFGYPVKKEGFMVSAAMLVAISVMTLIIFKV